MEEANVFDRSTTESILGERSTAIGLKNLSGISISEAARSHKYSSREAGEHAKVSDATRDF
jgi:hypothetical protein